MVPVFFWLPFANNRGPRFPKDDRAEALMDELIARGHLQVQFRGVIACHNSNSPQERLNLHSLFHCFHCSASRPSGQRSPSIASSAMSAHRLQAIASHLDPSSDAAPTTAIKEHSTLNARLHGIKSDRHGVSIEQYRGIKYGKVPARFQRAQLQEQPSNGQSSAMDCTSFGCVASFILATQLSILVCSFVFCV